MGYFNAPDWLVDDLMKNLDNSSLRVLLCLIRHSNKQGSSFPSIDTMAVKIGMTRKMVKKAIKKPRASCYISYEQTDKGKSNLYQLHERFVEDSKKQVGYYSTLGGVPEYPRGVTQYPRVG